MRRVFRWCALLTAAAIIVYHVTLKFRLKQVQLDPHRRGYMDLGGRLMSGMKSPVVISSGIAGSRDRNHPSLKSVSLRESMEVKSSSWKSRDQSMSIFSELGTSQTKMRELHQTAPMASFESVRKAIEEENALPLLTLFSTWLDPPDTDHDLIHNLTLQNWVKLKPVIVPVLFTNSSRVSARARENGWHVLPISRTAVGVPILKDMYLDAMARFNSTLYAFANGDILFTKTLVETILAVLTSPLLPLETTPLLLMGNRKNVKMVKPEETSFEDLARITKQRGRDSVIWAIDYFITDRKFPWQEIPDVIIGRYWFDNFIVSYSIQRRFVVIDASRTLLAVHQTGKAGLDEGGRRPNKHYNLDLLKRHNFMLEKGRRDAKCSPWLTEWTGKEITIRNVTIPRECEQ